MRYVVEIEDPLEIEALQELSGENNMTPEKYLNSLAKTYINKRLRGKLLEQARQMEADKLREKRLKEVK